MTTYKWVGDGGANLAGTAACWNPSGVPGASDDCVLDHTASRVCNWNIAAVISIDTTGFTPALTFNNDVALQGLTLDCTITGTSRTLRFRGIAKYTDHYIKLGANAGYTDITQFTFSINATAAGLPIKFDNGLYPAVALVTGGHITPTYLAPTVANSTTATMQSLTVGTGVTFSPRVPYTPTDDDRAKVFNFATSTNLVCTALTFDGGVAKWQFLAKAAPGYDLPVTGDTTNYGSSSTFTSHFKDIEIRAGTGGQFCTMPTGTRLVLNDFKIGVGAALKLYPNHSVTGGGCMVYCVNRPAIEGTWDFTQIADGIYISPRDTDVAGVTYGGTGNIGFPPKSLLVGAGNGPLTALALGSASQVLSVNGAGNDIEWAAAGGGGSQNVFSTIAVAGQSNVVADTTTDTLTFVGGTNVTLTTDATADSVTITSADTNTQLTQEQVEDFAGALVASGGTKAGITITYQDGTGDMDFAVTPNYGATAITEVVQEVNLGAPTINAATTMLIVNGGGSYTLPVPTAPHRMRIHATFASGCTLVATGGTTINLIGTTLTLNDPTGGADLFWIPAGTESYTGPPSWFVAGVYSPSQDPATVVT